MSSGILTSEEEKLKSILEKINESDVKLEDFFEQLEKEYGNKMFFSDFKSNFEKFYINIPKRKLFHLFLYFS